MNIDSKMIEKKFEENLEDIASVVHEIWAHWQSYLHDQCTAQPDGSLIIPKELVKQWNKQINLKYNQLTPTEQSSDIEQALKYKEIFLKILKELSKEQVS